jgi:hypothetical protein
MDDIIKNKIGKLQETAFRLLFFDTLLCIEFFVCRNILGMAYNLWVDIYVMGFTTICCGFYLSAFVVEIIGTGCPQIKLTSERAEKISTIAYDLSVLAVAAGVGVYYLIFGMPKTDTTWLWYIIGSFLCLLTIEFFAAKKVSNSEETKRELRSAKRESLIIVEYCVAQLTVFVFLVKAVIKILNSMENRNILFTGGIVLVAYIIYKNFAKFCLEKIEEKQKEIGE